MRKITSRNPGRLHTTLTDTHDVKTWKLSELQHAFENVLDTKNMTAEDIFFGIHQISSETESFG